jgi:hypothetical protein
VLAKEANFSGCAGDSGEKPNIRARTRRLTAPRESEYRERKKMVYQIVNEQ